MSELKTYECRIDIRRQLLATVSALALTGLTGLHDAKADDSQERPTVWIELGGQFERVDSTHTVFLPSSLTGARPAILTPIIDSQRPPAYGFGGEGKITFAPEESNWNFSAAVRYGRSNGTRHLHQQTQGHRTTTAGAVLPVGYAYFGDGQTDFHESHYVLDFQAGRDVGLGLFGSGSSSVVSAGVRIAQFTSNTNVVLHARPDEHFGPNDVFPSFSSKYNKTLHNYTAVLQIRRSTQAIGPSLSWDASLPLVGNREQAALDFDWGLNASVLFGRQRAETAHQTTAYYHALRFFHYPATQNVTTVNSIRHARTRSITIPNVGGFAGISWKSPHARVAVGYRADLFFNAVDVGIDTRKSVTQGFYGPFATISIGLGG